MLQEYEEYAGPLPDNEQQRLQTLIATGLLDTQESSLFNRVTQVTRDYLGVKTALISLVEKDRQWFKARCGLTVAETSRSVSFCTHAILSREVMVVPDAKEDPRFRANDLVTGPPFIRFYAGAPLIVYDEFAVGTLCVIDNKPWPGITPEQRAYLMEMAAIIAAMIEHHALKT